MNQLAGVIEDMKSAEGITHIFVKVEDKILSSLILSGDEEYKKNQGVNLLFKETEVMIATKNSMVSARNAFISPIKFINVGRFWLKWGLILKGPL